MLLFVLGFLLGLCSLAVMRLVIDLRASHKAQVQRAFNAAVQDEANRRYGVGHVHVVDDDDPFARLT